MKLHLPKSLRSALLGAMIMVPAIGITISATSWAAFAGPADVTYESVTAPGDSATLTPTTNTAYDMASAAKKTYTINADGLHVKLSGNNSTNDKENYLNAITAESLWVAGGSFVADSAADLEDAGDVYVGGGQIHFTADATYGNKFIVGATNVDTTHASLNAALRIGYWKTSGVDIVWNGNVEVQENAVFGFQNNSTLTINGALSGSGDIKMMLYDGKSNVTFAGDTSNFSGNLNISSDITLKVQEKAIGFMSSTGAIRLESSNTTLDLSSITYADGNTPTKEKNIALVNLMNKTTGAGTVKLAAQTGIQTSGDKTNVTLGTNYVVGTDNTASLILNSWKHDGYGTWRTWTVIKGGSITVGNGAGELNVRAGQQLIIENGGIVNAGQLLLGHEAVDNPGSVVMRGNDSQLTVSQFRGNAQKGNNWNNEVVINGGTLTITGTQAFAYRQKTEDYEAAILNVTIVGGAASTPVVLKTGSNDVLMSGDAASLGGGSFKLGNVIIDAANTNTITIQNATFGAGIVNNGKLVLGGVLKIEGEYSAYALGENGRYSVDDENGFYTSSGIQYFLVGGSGQNTLLTDEATYSGNSVALWLNADGDVIFTVDGESTTGDFFINNGSVDVVGAGAANSTGALKYKVSTKGTLNLTGGSLETFIIENNGAVNLGSSAARLIINTDNAAAYLTETTGQGTMELKKDVAFSNGGSVKFAGNLELASGVSLTLGNDSSNTAAYSTNFSSLSSLDLNGGTLNLYYVAPELKSMTVVEGATNSTIYIHDTSSEKLSKADATRINSLTLNSSLALTTNWKSSVNIGILSGAGNLTVSQAKTGDQYTSNLWIDRVDNYTGTVSVSGKMVLTLNIGENQSLNSSQFQLSGDHARMIVTGSGEYNFTGNVGSGVSVGDAWTGTVTITNASANGTSLASLGNASSNISINGMSGWIQRDDVTAHVELGVNGLTLTAYSTYGTYNFAGGISGAGDFILDSSSADDPHFSIGSNGTSEWKGGFIVKNMAAGKTAELKMVGGGELMAADSKGVQMNSNNGTLSLIIGNADVSTTMNGAVSKNANGSLNMTVQGDTVFNAGVTTSKIDVATDGSATFNGAVVTGQVNVLAGAEATFNQEIKTAVIDIAAGGEVVIANHWKNATAVSTDETHGVLRGAGNLTLKAATNASAANLTTTMFHVEDYSGVLDVENNAFIASYIYVNGEKSLKLDGSHNNGDAYIALYLQNAASVTTDITAGDTTIGIDRLQVSGQAVFGTDASLDSSNQGLAGVFDIGILIGVSDDTVNDNMIFRSNSKTSDITVFNLEAVEFYGRITLESTNTENYRYAALNIGTDDPEQIYASYFYQYSDIELLTGASETDQVVLGLVGDIVVRSIVGDDSDAYIVAGKVTETLADGETFKSTTDEYKHLSIYGLDEETPAVSSATIMSNINLTKLSDGSQIFNGDTTAFNGTVDVFGGTLGFGSSSLNTIETEVHDGQLQYADGAVTMTRLGEKDVVFAEITEASFSKAEDGTVCIDGCTMKNTLLSIKEATSLELGRVHMYDNSQVAGHSPASHNKVTLNHTTLVMENLGEGTLETLRPTTMSAEGMLELGLMAGAEGIIYTTDMFKDVDLTGTGYVAIGTLLADALLQHDYVALEFNQSYLDQNLQLITGVDIDPRLEGVIITTFIDTEAGRLYMSVPEPSTATLSLLALAALAARRRRK
ncbi:MAG: PEP-CTERM sorting domain-containing protein [Akkermansia sp.]|nr:PEP-CTERM sorting domain-containing protein [Akkermansia sp.]